MYFIFYKNQLLCRFLNYVLRNMAIYGYYTIDSDLIKDKSDSFRKLVFRT